MSTLDMSDKRLQMLKLSEQTVKELFVRCLRTEKTKGYINSTFYDRTSIRKAPIVQLDNSAVMRYTSLIRYLLGQMKAVHENKSYITPGSGSNYYTGERWTTDNNVLSALYYLSTAAGALDLFIDGEKYAYSDFRNLVTMLRPTYAPDDPRFNIKDAEKALKCLGIELS